jgi:hypothetical protein
MKDHKPKSRNEILSQIQERMEELKSDLSESPEVPLFRRDFTVFDFTPYNDLDFIKRIFHEFYKRDPNPKEELYFLTALRNNRVNKQELLALLLQSDEGRSHSVRIEAMESSFLNHPFLFKALGEQVLSGSHKIKKEYNLFELLKVKDEDFIASMYRIILNRDPDPRGYEYYINSMQSGRFNKLEIIGRIRYSGEGIRRAVKIRGLFIDYIRERVKRLPVIGSFLSDVLAVFRIFGLVGRFYRLEKFMEETYFEFQKSSRRMEERFNININQILSLMNEYMKAEQLRIRSDLLPSHVSGSAVYSLIATEHMTLNDIAHALRNGRELLPEGGMVVIRVSADTSPQSAVSVTGPFAGSVISSLMQRHGYRDIAVSHDREGRPIVMALRP